MFFEETEWPIAEGRRLISVEVSCYRVFTEVQYYSTLLAFEHFIESGEGGPGDWAFCDYMEDLVENSLIPNLTIWIRPIAFHIFSMEPRLLGEYAQDMFYVIKLDHSEIDFYYWNKGLTFTPCFGWRAAV